MQTNPLQPSTGTLADVMRGLEHDARLDAGRRRAYLGAARTMCKVLGRSAEVVPGSMAEIDRLLLAVPHPVRGVSKKTIANTRSRLKAALLHVAGGPVLPPHGTPLRPEWAALYEALTDARLRNGLSRLIRIASYRDVAPAKVDDAFLQDVLRARQQVNWGRDTLPFWRKSVALWNEAAKTVAGWPSRQLTPPPTSTRPRHFSLAELPTTFVRDLEAYLTWASGADLLADNAPRTPLKPSTLRQRREMLRLAASTLAAFAGYPKRIHRLASLVEPENMKIILNTYLKRAPSGKATAFIRGLAVTLLVVAKRWVKVRPERLEALKQINRQLKHAPAGLTAKNQDLIRQLEDPELRLALLNLPEKMKEELLRRRLSPARRLRMIQTALAIEILLVAPMRLQNLAMLELDRSLVWPNGRDGPVHVVLRRDETKNEEPLEYPITGRARVLLHEYLDRYRSYTQPGDRAWLFVHIDGTRVPESALRDGITKAVARGLGIKMTPHMFRHFAASLALDVDPNALGLVGDLLGHRNIKTTRLFYSGMRTRQAARAYDLILERSRAAAARRD